MATVEVDAVLFGVLMAILAVETIAIVGGLIYVYGQNVYQTVSESPLYCKQIAAFVAVLFEQQRQIEFEEAGRLTWSCSRALCTICKPTSLLISPRIFLRIWRGGSPV